MKTFRFLSLIVVSFVLAISAMAQSSLNDAEQNAQDALRDFLRSKNRAYNIDAEDNSLLFKEGDVVYWVTFKSVNSPAPAILYTIHRKGVKYENPGSFKAVCAYEACNEVNRKNHVVKAVCEGQEVLFYSDVYAKNPEDFHNALRNNVEAFKNVADTYKKTYASAYEAWKKDSIAQNAPQVVEQPLGKSEITVTSIAFCSRDMKGNTLVEYNAPLRKSNVCCIVAELELSASEKGVYKVGMKIYNPDGKIMLPKAGLEYTLTKNFNLPKANRPYGVTLDPYGSDAPDTWKAGEYKVEIYDYEKGALLKKESFNIL